MALSWPSAVRLAVAAVLLVAVAVALFMLPVEKVLGTPTHEEIQCTNRNYTVFGFRHIKAHPWHKFTIVLLRRHLVTVGAANQFAFSLLTVYLLRVSGILLPFLCCHEAHLRDPVGTEAVPPAAAPGMQAMYREARCRPV
ncbi:uncharacterized protein [Miscanthus floridulus]|uniref:uncharacterized protein n=1 Tax=Miscanthus floridulus TaxID=154761 RepID=UPI003457DC43